MHKYLRFQLQMQLITLQDYKDAWQRHHHISSLLSMHCLSYSGKIIRMLSFCVEISSFCSSDLSSPVSSISFRFLCIWLLTCYLGPEYNLFSLASVYSCLPFLIYLFNITVYLLHIFIWYQCTWLPPTHLALPIPPTQSNHALAPQSTKPHKVKLNSLDQASQHLRLIWFQLWCWACIIWKSQGFSALQKKGRYWTLNRKHSL